jgi:hypothetical protein
MSKKRDKNMSRKEGQKTGKKEEKAIKAEIQKGEK